MENLAIVVIVVSVIIGIIIGMNPLQNQQVQPAVCQIDSDCVPATCCHATACVLKQNAPNCEGIMCTMECRPGTIDCYGGCLCENGSCKANITS